MVARKNTFIQYVMIGLFIASVPFSAYSTNNNYQNDDTAIGIDDIKLGMRSITRFSLYGGGYDYKLSTNENRDSINLRLFHGIKDIDNFAPRSISSDCIDGVELLENSDNHALVQIKLKSDQIKYFDYVESKPPRLIIDLWKEKDEKKASGFKNKDDFIRDSLNAEKSSKDRQANTDKYDKEKSNKKETIAKKLPSTPKKYVGKSKKKSKKINKITKRPKLRVAVSKGRKTKLKDASVKKASYSASDDLRKLKEIKGQFAESPFNEEEKLYLHFAPLKNDIRLPAVKPEQKVINGEDEDQKLYNMAVTFYQRKKYAMALKSITLFNETFKNSPLKENIDFLNADIYFSMGEKVKSKNYFDKAISFYKDALRKYPSSDNVPQTLMFVGVAYFNKSLYYEALGSFEIGADKYPDNKYTLLMRLGAAEVYYKLKDYKSALRILEILKREYTDPEVARDAIFRIGDIYYEQNRYEEAITRYTDAMEIWPADIDLYPNALFNMAESHFQLKKYKKALRSYENFLKLFAKYIKRNENIYVFGSNALVRIAEIMDIMGASTDAVRKVLLETEFRFRDTYGARIAAIRRVSQDVPTANKKVLGFLFKEIDRIVEVSKESPELVEFALIVKGEALFNRKSYGKAVRHWEKHIVKYPRTIHLKRLKTNIVKALKRMIHKKMFTEEYHKALQIYHNHRARYFTDHNSFDIMFDLVDAYLNLGLFKEAEKYYNRVVKAQNLFKKKLSEQKEILERKKKSISFFKKKLHSSTKRKNKTQNDIATKEKSFVADFDLNGVEYSHKSVERKFISQSSLDYTKARIDMEKKKFDEAETRCLESIKKYPESKDKFLRLLASIYFREKKWKNCTDTFLKTELKTVGEYKYFAYASMKQRKYLDAAKHYRILIDKEMIDKIEYPAIKFKIANLYFKAKKYKRAIKAYSNYVTDYPNEKLKYKAIYQMGESYHRMRRTNDALKTWESIAGDRRSGMVGKMAEESIKTILWKRKFRRQLR